MINLQEYQKLAHRTWSIKQTNEIGRQHIILGIISEYGEMADAYKKHLAYGKELDKVNVLEEWADALWYLVNYYTLIEKEVPTPDENYLIKYQNKVEEIPADLIFYSLLYLSFQESEMALDGEMLSLDISLNRHFALGIQLGFTKEELYKALENNINKLKVRYPEKFTEDLALNRNLEQERKELEK